MVSLQFKLLIMVYDLNIFVLLFYAREFYKHMYKIELRFEQMFDFLHEYEIHLHGRFSFFVCLFIFFLLPVIQFNSVIIPKVATLFLLIGGYITTRLVRLTTTHLKGCHS